MKSLIIADLHLTDKEDDLYRFEIFSTINHLAEKVDKIIFLGDMTDSKDNLSGWLINKIADEVAKLRKPVIILKGNHDYYKDAENPTLRFLDYFPGVTFITEPQVENMCLFLPHSRNPVKDWDYYKRKFGKYDYIFMHQLIIGGKSEDGYEFTEGLPLESMLGAKQIIAGDLHKPQVLKDENTIVTYVGSPYHIHYKTNDFQGRLLILDHARGHLQTMHLKFPFKMRLAVTDVLDFKKEVRRKELYKGDKIKVHVLLHDTDCINYKEISTEIEEICKEKELQLKGISLKRISDKMLSTALTEAGKMGDVKDIGQVIKELCKAQALGTRYSKVAEEILKEH